MRRVFNVLLGIALVVGLVLPSFIPLLDKVDADPGGEISKRVLDQVIWNEWSKNKTPSIKLSEFGYVMDTMSFNAQFKYSVQDEKPFIYEAEGKSISFKPTGMWWVTPKGETTARTVAPAIGSLTEGKVKYPSAFGNGIDIECSTDKTRWRKEIIIKSLQSLGAIPIDAEYLEIGFEVETDFDIEGWDKKSELKFNTAVKLSELSQLESIKTWDNHIIPEPKEGEEPEDPFERCDGFFRVVDGKYFLVKRIPADYLRDAVYPVTTDVEIAYGAEYTFNAVATHYVSCAALDDTHFVVGFQDYGGDDYGIARIGTVSGNTIAYGSEYTFNAAATYSVSCAALDSTHFIVGFEDIYNGPGKCVVGVVTGDAIAYGSEYTFNGANTGYISCAALDSTHFVVGFQDDGGADHGIAMIGVVTGDAIAYGAEYTFNAVATRYVSCAALDTTHFVVGFTDNDSYGKCMIGVVTGNAIAYGTEYTFNTASANEISCAALDSTHFVVGFKDGGDGDKGKCMIGVVSSGNQIAFGSEYEFNAPYTDYISCAALDNTHFVVGFEDRDGDTFGKCRVGVVTGNAIAYGTKYTFNAAVTTYISCAALDTTHFVVGFKDTGGGDYGIAMIGTYTPPVLAPTVTTQAVSSISTTTAQGNGTLVDDGVMGL